jgi:hypothetical protein
MDLDAIRATEARLADVYFDCWATFLVLWARKYAGRCLNTGRRSASAAAATVAI